MSFAMTDRCALGVLALLKLKKDFSQVRQADITWSKKILSRITEHLRCRTCTDALDLADCSNQCPATQEADRFATGCLAAELSSLIKGRAIEFWNDSCYCESDKIRDCSDGSRHHRFMQQIPTADDGARVITLAANMDGVKLFKDSNKSIWPIIFVINELPKESRGKGKPPDVPFKGMLTQLEADLKAINANEGIPIEVNEDSLHMRVYVSRMAGDLPAKAEMLNMIYHNNFFGCGICEHPGFSTAKGDGYNHSYAPTGIAYRRRSRKRMIGQANEPTGTTQVKGIKGLPAVNALPHSFSCAWYMIIDDLHTIFIGVVKKIMKM